MHILAEEITMNTVEANRIKLLAYLQEEAETAGETVLLDASNLHDIDAAGVQLLLSAHKSASQRGLRLQLVNSGDFLMKTLEYSGAGDVLSP